MEAVCRGARRKLISGFVVAVGAVVWASPPDLLAQNDVSSMTRSQFTARYRSALASLWKGDPADAVAPLRQLYLDGGCEIHKCELRLAQAHRYLDQLDEALRWARAAVERAETKGGTGAEEYNELGVVTFEMSKVDSAFLPRSEEALRESVKRHQSLGDTYLYNLSQVLLAAGQREEASEIFREFEASAGLRPVIEKGEAVIGEFQRVKVVERKYAQYTDEARRQGTQGQIHLQAIIDSRGQVAETEVIQGLPHGLTEEAVRALIGSTFHPATVDGQPVAAVYRQMLEMKLTPQLLSQRQIVQDDHSH